MHQATYELYSDGLSSQEIEVRKAREFKRAQDNKKLEEEK